MPPMLPVEMPAESDLRERLLEAVPALRAFAHALADDGAYGDELVQETLLRAWSGAEGVADGAVTPWLFTILRRRFYTEPPPRPERADRAGLQTDPPEAARFREALRRLPDIQREALLLVGGQHFTDGEAAAICGVGISTLRSRVARARLRLATALRPPPGHS